MQMSSLLHPVAGAPFDKHLSIANHSKQWKTIPTRKETKFISLAPSAPRRRAMLKSLSSSHADDTATGPITDFELIFEMQSSYSLLKIVDVAETAKNDLAGFRLLFLDNSGCVQSVYRKGVTWTEAYWDEFSSLAPIIPAGPIGFLGLAGGTAIRTFRIVWPDRVIHAWEIDFLAVEMARDFFGLSDVEKASSEGGNLTVHVGDALSDDAVVEGGFAGLVVDLFANGKVIPQLEEEATWHKLKARLLPGGRIIANLGGPIVNRSSGQETNEAERAKDSALAALRKVFPDELSLLVTSNSDVNTIAMSGELPCPHKWASSLPDQLKKSAYDWKIYA